MKISIKIEAAEIKSTLELSKEDNTIAIRNMLGLNSFKLSAMDKLKLYMGNSVSVTEPVVVRGVNLGRASIYLDGSLQLDIDLDLIKLHDHLRVVYSHPDEIKEMIIKSIAKDADRILALEPKVTAIFANLKKLVASK